MKYAPLILVILSILACGVPVTPASTLHTSASTPAEPDARGAIALPLPLGAPTPGPVQMIACGMALETVYIRSGAGTSFPTLDTLTAGDTVTVTGSPILAPDGGVWREVVTSDGLAGYTNARYLCKTKK
jgi:uncharacterized protein YgiM (DUF1202 family)